MSAIQPMDVATPHPAMPVPASTVPGDAQPGRPFAEVMRSAVSPAARASYSSGASASSLAQSNRSSMTAGTKSHRAEASPSMLSGQATMSNPSIRTGDVEDANVHSSAIASSPSADMSGAASSLADGQAQSSIPAEAVGDRLSGATPQRIHTAAADTETSPKMIGRKSTFSAKQANGSQGASASSAVVTAAQIAVTAAPEIATRTSTLSLPRELGTASSATDPSPSKLKSIGSSTEPTNSSVSNRATVPGGATPTPQGDGAPLRGVQSIDAGASATSNADATQNGKSAGDAGASEPAVDGDGASAQVRTNGSAIVAGDANPANSGGVNGIGNPGAVGKDSGGSDGDRTATSIHGSDSLRSASFSAATPTVATAAKDLPGPHATAADSGGRLQNNPGVFSAGYHAGAPGSFPSSTSVPPAPRATTADAFTALDSAAAGERGVLLHAAPHQVAIGVADPSLGWVEVRAERVSGQIAAALTTNSAASHAALTSVLPTMATYLQEHNVGVQQVHVESSLAGGQPGTGSQGQPASQSDTRTSSDKNVVASSAGRAWNAAPIERGAIPMNQGTNFLFEGHHFSIRA